MAVELRIELAETGADTSRLDALTRQVNQQLLQLDVGDVSTVAASPPPAGSRALDGATIEALLVAVGTAVQGLATAISVMRDWRKREPDDAHRRVVLKIEGDVLELPAATPAEEERLVSLFIARHAPGPRA